MRALEPTKIFQLLADLVSGEILDRMKDGRGMWLHRHAVLRAENVEVKHCHDGCERGGGCLVAADLYLTGGADVVGMMDHPCRKPERAALQIVEG